MPCECICHEEWGGGAHPKQKCVCNGGQGFDDFNDPPKPPPVVPNPVGPMQIMNSASSRPPARASRGTHDSGHAMDVEGFEVEHGAAIPSAVRQMLGLPQVGDRFSAVAHTTQRAADATSRFGSVWKAEVSPNGWRRPNPDRDRAEALEMFTDEELAELGLSREEILAKLDLEPDEEEVRIAELLGEPRIKSVSKQAAKKMDEHLNIQMQMYTSGVVTTDTIQNANLVEPDGPMRGVRSMNIFYDEAMPPNPGEGRVRVVNQGGQHIQQVFTGGRWMTVRGGF